MHSGILKPDLGFWDCLRAPGVQIGILARSGMGRSFLPYALWCGMATLALGGTALYGATLACVFPAGTAIQWALVLMLSTGFSWFVLGPVLAWVTGTRPLVCVHACLVTMSFGEFVLLAGAAANLCLHLSGHSEFGLAVNLIVLAISNILMACILLAQFKALGTPPGKTLTVWMAALNLPGMGLFLFFHELIFQTRVKALLEVLHAFLG